MIMRKDPPVKVSQEEVKFHVSEIEPILCGPSMDIPEFTPVTLKLKDDSTLLIRPAKLEEAPKLLGYLEKVMKHQADFYDIVGARIYAEVLGWYRNRLKDPYTLVGTIDGELAGFCNGRLMNEDINISLHSLALKRGLRIGAAMYYAKCYYCFEILEQEEFWATYESYNGFKRWGIGMAQPSYPWPDVQHELGGARVYYVTKDYWYSTVKDYLEQMLGATFKKATKAAIKKSEKLIIPKKVVL
jgi:hypothetical protein